MGRAQELFELETVASGPVVSGQEYNLRGNRELQAVTILSGGTATISVNNGTGYSAPEDIPEGASVYDLINCSFKIALTGGATVGVS